MNLFCFSLEGSMDSLYEPVQNTQEPKEDTLTRASSPQNTFTRIVPHERSLSLEKNVMSPVLNLNQEDVEYSELDNTDVKWKRKRSLIQKSVSENEAFDRKSWPTAYWQNPRRGENDSYFRKHCHIEDLSEDDGSVGDRINLLSRRKAEDNLNQMPSCEQWMPSYNQSSNGSSVEVEMDDNRSEAMGTLKRLQKLVRAKKAGVNDDAKHTLLSVSPAQDFEEEEEQTVTTCMKLTKSQEKKSGKDNLRKKQEAETYTEVTCSTSERPSVKWNISGNSAIIPEKNIQMFSDWKAFPENVDPFIYSLMQTEEWEKCTCCNHHSQLSYSLTDMDLPYSWVNFCV